MKLPCLAVLCLALTSSVSARTFEIDPHHSSISFKIRHLVSNVRGSFDKFTGTLEYEKDKPQSWKVQAEVDAASINTNVAPRDKHLRSPDFFDVEKCPKIVFKSTKVDAAAGKLHGDLTMHCVTKPVVLDLNVSDLAKDPWGAERLGSSASGTLNRKDWGLTWNKALEAGGALVGDEVRLEIDIEAVPSKPKDEAKKKS